MHRLCVAKRKFSHIRLYDGIIQNKHNPPFTPLQNHRGKYGEKGKVGIKKERGERFGESPLREGERCAVSPSDVTSVSLISSVVHSVSGDNGSL